MFQLTTPLTPAPGRAGSVVVPGAASAKGAVALPDFLSLALPVVPDGIPGNARQDPAGGGEAVPGGTVVAPPAGHPDTIDFAAPASTVEPTVVSGGVVAGCAPEIACTKAASTAMDAPKGRPSRGLHRPEGSLESRVPKAALTAVAGQNGRSDAKQTAAASTESSLPKDVLVSNDGLPDAIAATAAPMLFIVPTLSESPPPALAIAADAVAADASADRGAIAAARPIAARPSRLVADATSPATDRHAPPVHTRAVPDATDAALPAPGGADMADAISPETRDSNGGAGITPVIHSDADRDDVPTMAPAAARLAIVRPIAAHRFAAEAVAAAPNAGPRRVDPGSISPGAVVRTPEGAYPIATDATPDAVAVAPDISSRGVDSGTVSRAAVARMLKGADPIVTGAPDAVAAAPTAGPRRIDAGAVSLGTVARMLEGAYPVAAGVTPDAAAAARPATPAPASAPRVAALPAMPASVATFLASVGPRPVAVPLPDARPAAAQHGAILSAPVSTTAAPAVPLAPVAIQPAGQIFAAAIHAATGRGQRTRSTPTEGDALGVSSTLTAPTVAAATAAVTDRTPVDLTQPHWPAKMIERIEILRDAADAQDTRIKLIPDALGAIDVSMKREGDTVHVHLAAERPETRAMIADAQPRLAELGEQRGLKIAASNGQAPGQGSQAGAQDFHQQRGNPAPQQPARPASARAGDSTTSEDEGGQRLA